MTIPFTSVVYFPVALAIGFISFRFYNEWKETETRDNLIYALAFTALTIVCSTGVLAGTIFSSKEGIVLMLVVSSIFVAIANGFYSYLFLYYRFPRISPWLGFTITFLYGILVTVYMVFNPINPVIEPSGGIFWGIPMKIGILRSFIYILGMAPLMSVHINNLLHVKDREQIPRNLFLILFFSLTLVVVIVDFIIEPLFDLHALISEVVLLVLAVIGMVLYFFFHEFVLLRSQKRFKRLVDNMPDLVCLIDREGIIQYANRAHERILGYKPETLTGKSIFDLILPKDLKMVKEKLQLSRMSTSSSRFEFRFVHVDGTPVWVESFGSFFLDEATAPEQTAKIVIASRDITERKLLENSLRQSQKMEAVGMLAGGVAHDFNNLLTVINGYADIILSKIEPHAPFFDYLQQIKNAGERAASLTRQLLAFSRKQLLKPEIINLNELTRSMEKMLSRLLRENISLMTIFDPQLKYVQADPGQIEQVILNLAINASDAMPDGGVLTIETRNMFLDKTAMRGHTDIPPGEYVMLAVSDTGMGMDKTIIDRIFEPFFTTKEVGKGTGLGLSTVYGIIKQSNGEIWVYSEPGKGTTFKIFLPVVEKNGDQQAPQIALTEFKGTETILIVEDDDAVRKMARQGLEGFGYRLFDLTDGEEALEFVTRKEHAIDLLLTDVVMPKMSGKELADYLRRMIPGLKVVFMSGYTDNAIVHHGILEDGIHFIQKPFTAIELAKKIRAVLDS